MQIFYSKICLIPWEWCNQKCTELSFNSILVLRNNEVEFMGIQPAVMNILEGKPYVVPRSSLAQTLAIEKIGNER